MNLLKAYFEYVSSPQRALRQMLEQRSLAQACIGYLAAALSWVLFFNIGDGVSFPVLLLKIGLVFAAEVTAGYILASFCGLFLDFMHVATSPAQLFVLIGTAGFIKGLLIAFALISAAFPWAHLGWLAPLALLLVLGLQLGYLTRGVKRTSAASYGQAIAAWLFAFVPLAGSLILLGIFIIWGIGLLFS